MGYRNNNNVYFYEADHSINFSITSRWVVEELLKKIEEMAHDAIKENDYKRTLELLSILIEGEEALEKFNQPKFEPTFPRTSTGLLEEE